MREESEKKAFCKIRGREIEPHGRRMSFQSKKNEFFGLADCSELSCLCAVETLHDEHVINIEILFVRLSSSVRKRAASIISFLPQLSLSSFSFPPLPPPLISLPPTVIVY